MQTTIYFIRHGEAYNPDHILYARMKNIHLTQKGKLESEEAAAFLKDKNIYALYASPLERTQETADIIREHLGVKTITVSGLINEIGTSYQGWKMSKLDEIQSDIYRKPLDPSDETVRQIAHRMSEFVTKIVQRHPNKNIAAVGHGDPLMILRAVVEGKDPGFYVLNKGYYIQLCEIYQVTTDEHNNFSVRSVFKPSK